MTVSTNSVISAEQLSVTVGQQEILKQLDFDVVQGDVFALLGGNGAGKSTTLKTLLGLIKPVSGYAQIMNKDVHKHPQVITENVTYLPESVMLYSHLNAFENLRYFLSLAGLKRSDDDIGQALERVSLQTGAWHRPLQHYSKGMRQKTAIALALLRITPVLLLDEPTSGLDPVAIDEFNQLIKQLAAGGATILMVTHDVYGACHVANQIGLLRDGQIVGMFSALGNQTIDTEAVHAAFAQGVAKNGR